MRMTQSCGKTALDGLVMMADEPVAVAPILEVLAAAAAIAEKEKRSWIDEANEQIRSGTQSAKQQLDCRLADQDAKPPKNIGPR